MWERVKEGKKGGYYCNLGLEYSRESMENCIKKNINPKLYPTF